ncbi:Glycosyl transferase, family 8 [Cynara cardunculus var. scolymus]|uniref:Hexosyltransferase n=1 Tax=Cynara cardunculus var. scolymus TaxID=59895 RepID=A0A118K6A0_CYNCS|nr:Glycosyl transferase, family 8 [Cynara cardunculus var. scolymus]
MQLHISPSLRHVTLLPGKGVRELIQLKVGSRRLSYKMLFYSLLLFTFLLRFIYVLTTVDTVHDHTKCSIVGCLGEKLSPKLLGGRNLQSASAVPQVIYQILEDPSSQDEIIDIPQTLEEFVTSMKGSNRPDAKTFATKLKSMVTLLEQRSRTAKIKEYLYRHVASTGIPKQLHCLALRLAHEHATNADARLQLPLPELVPALVDNCYFHFVLASDNILAASVVATSLVYNALRPQMVVIHIITDRKTYSPMQAWFSLHPLAPAVIDLKALHHFDWFANGKVPVLEAMEKDQRVRAGFRGGSSAIVANNTEKPNVIAAKLQAMSPKYNSLMNHVRIYLPQMFPSLKKVVFLDDDLVVQSDLSPLWEIDMKGKVNGAVETCRGGDKFVMSKRFKSYLNFSHPLISKNFDANECAWAYGMNIFDLQAWRKTNITQNYHYWVQENLKSDLSLWQLGTLPPGLIAFHGEVHVIDPFWHMLGLGYQENTSVADIERAAVLHFNGRAKPWLDIAFPKLRRLWTKYINFSDKFIKSCHITAS